MTKSSKPIKTVAFMMGATVLSKVLGLLREMLLASAYGAENSVAEAFSAALTVPSAFFDILFSAAILGCFIPVYNSFKEQNDEAERFACTFLNAIALLTGLLALIGIIFADIIIKIQAPGLEDPALAGVILRILFPMIIFTGMAYTLVGLMQSKGRFFLPALISSISNAGVIVYFIFFDRFFGVFGLACAYGLSWVIQFATLAIPLWRDGFRFRAVFDFKEPHFITALKMVPPIMIGSWLSPMTLLIGKRFATPFNGAVIFDKANQTYIMIAGILVYSICNYVFPTLSRLAGDGDEEGFRNTVKTGTRTAMFIILPIMAAVFVLSGEGVTILYRRGEFTAENAAATAELLRIIACAMPAYGLIEIFSRVFYARKMTLYPVIASLCGVGAIFGVCFILTEVFGMGLISVAIGVCAGQWIAALTLMISAGIKVKGLIDISFVGALLKNVICGVVAFAAMWGISTLIGGEPYGAGLIKNIINCVIVFGAGAVCYLVSAVILRAFPKK